MDSDLGQQRRGFALSAAMALMLFLGVNWIGVTVHIHNLKHAAGPDRGLANSDAHYGYLADAQGFQSAQMLFAIGTLAMFGVAAFLVIRGRR